QTGTSIGIAIAPIDADNADDLLMSADLALYAVKAAGRGNCRFYQKAMNDEINRRRRFEIDLREAMERDELKLSYQPIIDLRNDRLIGVEALTRWPHPRRGVVAPSEFIALAEDNGLILTLGSRMLAEACRQAARWPADLKIAVNLSPVQFASRDLCQAIEAVL